MNCPEIDDCMFYDKEMENTFCQVQFMLGIKVVWG